MMEQPGAARHAFCALQRPGGTYCAPPLPLVYRRPHRMARRSLIHNREGVSTTEYVILLLVVACIGIAGWRLLGTTAFSRATSASGDMSGLGSSGDGSGRGGGGGGGGGGGASSGSPRTRLEDATADATPPPDPKDELVMPFTLLAGALLLLIAMGAKRMKTGDGGGGGAEGGEAKTG